MKVEFTAHALRRLGERNISEEAVYEALTTPDEVIEVKHGRRAARKHEPSCYHIVTIYEAHREALIVVTAIRVDERRIRKIGFTGI